MKKKVCILFFVFACMISTACTNVNRKVAVTIYPMQYLVERIAGDSIEVVNISKDEAIQTTTIIDNYQEELNGCSILFHVNELEPYLDVYSTGISETDVELVNTVSETVQNRFARYTSTNVDGKTVVVDTPYYDDNSFNRVDTYKYDPTIWQDPIMMISAAEVIRDALIEKYPELEATFKKNYEQLEYDLTSLDVKYQELKKSTYQISFVSMTPSFGYLQEGFGIHVYPVCLSKYGALPNGVQYEAIKQRIIEDQVYYIVHEENLSEEMEELYERLVYELQLNPIELSNLSSLSESEKSENKDYLTIMYDNLSTLELLGQ